MSPPVGAVAAAPAGRDPVFDPFVGYRRHLCLGCRRDFFVGEQESKKESRREKRTEETNQPIQNWRKYRSSTRGIQPNRLHRTTLRFQIESEQGCFARNPILEPIWWFKGRRSSNSHHIREKMATELNKRHARQVPRGTNSVCPKALHRPEDTDVPDGCTASEVR